MDRGIRTALTNTNRVYLSRQSEGEDVGYEKGCP